MGDHIKIILPGVPLDNWVVVTASTFRVDLEGKTIRAYELGRTEGINNKGEEAGNRKVINTLIAEGGWAGFQKLQWDKVTKFLVHAIEIDK